MHRLLISVLALLLPTGTSAQEAAGQNGDPVVIINGVVQYPGIVYEPTGSVDHYGLTVEFIAWRQDDGPVSTQALSLHIKAGSKGEIEAIQGSFRRGQIARFEADGPLTFHGPNEGAQSVLAGLGQLIAPVEDAELLAAAENVWKPEGFADPELGEFEPHPRLYEHFGQIREWLGKKTVFEVILEPMGPNARERALNMARIVWNDHVAIDETIRESVTDSIYSDDESYLEAMIVPVGGGEPIANATEDDHPPISREDFKANHRLTRVSCSAQDYCALEYVAQGIEWYWTYDATIRRKDDGWYLDGWDFP
ncbi:hypothetical protein WAB17_02170 [Parerythrobacter aurantius]|uniref:hypothetical protein n=1 Tax=Parerythrobacter aurantius TaxID=3127706 RepID=UPI00324BB205